MGVVEAGEGGDGGQVMGCDRLLTSLIGFPQRKNGAPVGDVATARHADRSILEDFGIEISAMS